MEVNYVNVSGTLRSIYHNPKFFSHTQALRALPSFLYKHCEYQSLLNLQVVPDSQHLGPFQLRPPHCPYLLEQGPEVGWVVTVVVVVDLVVDLVVEVEVGPELLVLEVPPVLPFKPLCVKNPQTTAGAQLLPCPESFGSGTCPPPWATQLTGYPALQE